MVLTEADIAVFVGTLLISISAGIFYAIKDKKKYSTENYYFGGRKLSPIPVAASLSVSYVSAIAIVAIPVEVYMYGSVYAWDMLTGALSKLIAAACFLPIYHKLKLTSVYELMYLGVVLYLPALSLSATTSLTVYAAIATTGIICTFYTTIGGVKAVIWTDLLQSFMMVAGILGLFISTVMSVGGIGELIGAVKRGGRDNLLSFDPDPRIRSSFWTVTVGSTINGCYNTCCSQVYVQRYLSCKNKKTARTALLLSVIPEFVLILLCVANGLVLYAYYENCDPVLNGELEKVDEAIPYLALEVFQKIPGMTGLFVAAVFSGTLSTVSSGINAMSSLVLHDFLLTYSSRMKKRTKIVASLILSTLFGALVTAFAFFASTMTSNIVGIIISFAGVLCGPMLGIFTMAVMMPWVNSKGAIFGFAFGLVAVLSVGIASFFAPEHYSPLENGGKLPLSTNYCVAGNESEINVSLAVNQTHSSDISLTSFTTIANNPETSSVIIENPRLDCDSDWPSHLSIFIILYSLIISTTLLSISPYLYGCLGWAASIMAGSAVSILAGEYNPSHIDWRLFAPGVKALYCRKSDEDDKKVEGLQMTTLAISD